MHVDLAGRYSLAPARMGPERADVDRWVLGDLERRTFETREGGCRLMPKLAKAVAENTSRWATLLAPVVDRIVKSLTATGAERSS